MTRILEIRALGAALDAAFQHELVQDLARQPADARVLAERCGLDALACERVLEVLRANGIVVRENGAYRVTDAVRQELIGPGHRTEGGSRVWEHVGDFLTTGRPIRPMDDAADRGRAYAEATPHLGSMLEPFAERLAAALAGRLSRRSMGEGDSSAGVQDNTAGEPAQSAEGGVSVLDVGAGSGVWSLTLVRRLPGARARALDLPEVLPRFLDRAETLGLENQVDASPGDYHDAPAPGRHDVVILANVLHLERAPDAARLVERWGAAVAPGGMLVVVDMLSATGEEPAHAAYALHLAMRVPGAFPHLEPDVRRWLDAAEFCQVERLALDEGIPMAALVASRSAAPPRVALPNNPNGEEER